jgi:enolase-phosphatase E1
LSIKYILTDIEGTTTSVSFVYEVLFPYFRTNIPLLKNSSNKVVQQALGETKKLAFEMEQIILNKEEEVLAHLLKWSIEDKKITPLKTLQGILWKEGYETGELKGHVYDDVPVALKAWKEAGLNLGVFSSGSVEAQQLIFGFSIFGDLRPYFSNYFDTKTGGKREVATYLKIASILNLNPSEILFLSDIKEELEAAKKADFQTIQLVRPGTKPAWEQTASNFKEINLNS